MCKILQCSALFAGTGSHCRPSFILEHFNNGNVVSTRSPSRWPLPGISVWKTLLLENWGRCPWTFGTTRFTKKNEYTVCPSESSYGEALIKNMRILGVRIFSKNWCVFPNRRNAMNEYKNVLFVVIFHFHEQWNADHKISNEKSYEKYRSVAVIQSINGAQQQRKHSLKLGMEHTKVRQGPTDIGFGKGIPLYLIAKQRPAELLLLLVLSKTN